MDIYHLYMWEIVLGAVYILWMFDLGLLTISMLVRKMKFIYLTQIESGWFGLMINEWMRDGYPTFWIVGWSCVCP